MMRRAQLKPMMLPIAIVGGLVLHKPLEALGFLSPWLLFAMLLVTFCRVNPSDLKMQLQSHHKMLIGLLAVQTFAAPVLYFMCLPMGQLVACGAYLCVLCPTATAAPVVTGMLGGSVSRVATYSILCNLLTAFLAPLALTLIGHNPNMSFGMAVWAIAQKVGPLILCPMALAFILGKLSPTIHHRIATHQGISFYLWAIALFLIVGNAAGMLLKEPAGMIPQMILMAGVALAACVGQFWTGRKIGRLSGDPISGAQGLGQKNTVLAIWMASMYLNPVTTVAPAAYIVWQNIINSYQLMRHTQSVR